MSDTPRTDAAIQQWRYREKRGDWEGFDMFLFVEPEFARDLERENKELLEALKAMVKTWEAYLSSPHGYPAFSNACAVIDKAEGK